MNIRPEMYNAFRMICRLRQAQSERGYLWDIDPLKGTEKAVSVFLRFYHIRFKTRKIRGRNRLEKVINKTAKAGKKQ